jgi:hypothetical protein
VRCICDIADPFALRCTRAYIYDNRIMGFMVRLLTATPMVHCGTPNYACGFG